MAVRIITDSTVDIADKYRNLFTVVPKPVRQRPQRLQKYSGNFRNKETRPS